eukprot:6258667-Lingulodinium_polyedra.AAC.1
MMRSNRPSAVAAVCKPHAACVPCERHFRWCSHGVCEACDLRAVAAAPEQPPSSAQAAPEAAPEA